MAESFANGGQDAERLRGDFGANAVTGEGGYEGVHGGRVRCE